MYLSSARAAHIQAQQQQGHPPYSAVGHHRSLSSTPTAASSASSSSVCKSPRRLTQTPSQRSPLRSISPSLKEGNNAAQATAQESNDVPNNSASPTSSGVPSGSETIGVIIRCRPPESLSTPPPHQGSQGGSKRASFNANDNTTHSGFFQHVQSSPNLPVTLHPSTCQVQVVGRAREARMSYNAKLQRSQPQTPTASMAAQTPTSTQTQTFAFSSVLGGVTSSGTRNRNDSQTCVFEHCVPLIDSVLLGYNSTLFTYGQSGSGKTFTCEGVWEGDSTVPPHGSNVNVALPATVGILPRAFQHLINSVNQMRASPHNNTDYTIRGTYVEIYNEVCYDLLNGLNVLSVNESPHSGSFYVKDARDVVIQSMHDVWNCIRVGAKHKRMADTLLNAHSSRSHTIFTIYVEMQQWLDSSKENSIARVGKLNVVDLAGSERLSASRVEGVHKREAASINQSLFALGRCINALSQLQQSQPNVLSFPSPPSTTSSLSIPAPGIGGSPQVKHRRNVSNPQAPTTQPQNQQQPLPQFLSVNNTMSPGLPPRSVKGNVSASVPASYETSRTVSPEPADNHSRRNSVSSVASSGSNSGANAGAQRSPSPDGGASPPPTHIPYRTSKLTMILKDSLGGHSRTLLIACIRPEYPFLDSTLSTLLFATRLKKIRNQPIVNEDPRDQVLRRLQEDNARLMREVERIKGEMTEMQQQQQNKSDLLDWSAKMNEVATPFRAFEGAIDLDLLIAEWVKKDDRAALKKWLDEHRQKSPPTFEGLSEIEIRQVLSFLPTHDRSKQQTGVSVADLWLYSPSGHALTLDAGLSPRRMHRKLLPPSSRSDRSVEERISGGAAEEKEEDELTLSPNITSSQPPVRDVMLPKQSLTHSLPPKASDAIAPRAASITPNIATEVGLHDAEGSLEVSMSSSSLSPRHEAKIEAMRLQHEAQTKSPLSVDRHLPPRHTSESVSPSSRVNSAQKSIEFAPNTQSSNSEEKYHSPVNGHIVTEPFPHRSVEFNLTPIHGPMEPSRLKSPNSADHTRSASQPNARHLSQQTSPSSNDSAASALTNLASVLSKVSSSIDIPPQPPSNAAKLALAIPESEKSSTSAAAAIEAPVKSATSIAQQLQKSITPVLGPAMSPLPSVNFTTMASSTPATITASDAQAHSTINSSINSIDALIPSGSESYSSEQIALQLEIQRLRRALATAHQTVSPGRSNISESIPVSTNGESQSIAFQTTTQNAGDITASLHSHALASIPPVSSIHSSTAGMTSSNAASAANSVPHVTLRLNELGIASRGKSVATSATEMDVSAGTNLPVNSLSHSFGHSALANHPALSTSQEKFAATLPRSTTVSFADPLISSPVRAATHRDASTTAHGHSVSANAATQYDDQRPLAHSVPTTDWKRVVERATSPVELFSTIPLAATTGSHASASDLQQLRHRLSTLESAFMSAGLAQTREQELRAQNAMLRESMERMDAAHKIDRSFEQHIRDFPVKPKRSHSQAANTTTPQRQQSSAQSHVSPQRMPAYSTFQLPIDVVDPPPAFGHSNCSCVACGIQQCSCNPSSRVTPSYTADTVNSAMRHSKLDSSFQSQANLNTVAQETLARASQLASANFLYKQQVYENIRVHPTIIPQSSIQKNSPPTSTEETKGQSAAPGTVSYSIFQSPFRT